MNLKKSLILYLPSLALWGLIFFIGTFTFPVWTFPFAFIIQRGIDPGLSVVLGMLWILGQIMMVHAFRIMILSHVSRDENRYWLLYLGHLMFFPAALAMAFIISESIIAWFAIFYLIYLLVLIVLFFRQSRKAGLLMIPYILWIGSIILYAWIVTVALRNFTF